jgi:hypothetical protein
MPDERKRLECDAHKYEQVKSNLKLMTRETARQTEAFAVMCVRYSARWSAVYVTGLAAQRMPGTWR